MKKIIFILVLLFPLSANAAVRISAQDGDWGLTSTWIGGVVPGNGDQVSIFHVVNATDTRIIGTSLAEGTTVVHLNSTGTIHITSTGYLKVRGDVIYTGGTSNTNDAVIVDGGGIFEFDSSQAASPTSQNYAFYYSDHFGRRKFKVSGSAGARATLKANTSSGMGALRTNGFIGGEYEFLYANLSNMSFETWMRHDATDPTGWNVTYSTFSACGLISDLDGIYINGSFIHDHNYHTGTVGGVIFSFIVSSAYSSGTRSIQYNVFDGQLGTNLGLKDFTINGNYMEDGFNAYYSSAVWTNNFFRMKSNLLVQTGSTTASYFFLDNDMTNPHVTGPSGDYDSSWNGIIWGQSGKANGLGGDDSGEFILSDGPTVVSTVTLQNSIFLPNGNGYSSLEAGLLLGSAGDSNSWTKRNMVMNHNTWFGGWAFGMPGFSMLDFSETVNMAPGMINIFKNNIVWNPQIAGKIATFSKMYDVGNYNSDQTTGFGTGPTQNVCTPANCDYNAGYNSSATYTGGNISHYTNQGKGYIGKFSATPGTHDVDAQNPQFVNYHRNVENFDAGFYRPYISQAAATAWSSGASYSVGDVVAHSTSTLYWGDTINYRYTNGSGCSSANPEPGAGLQSAWVSCWEWASLYDIRSSILSSATFTSSSIGATNATAIETVMKWVRAGYAPTNSAYDNVASDGGDIGAVPFTNAVPAVVSPLMPVVNQGATLQFTADSAGTWSCSGTTSTGGVTACAGSINATTGLYTAPSSVTAQHVYGGMQIGPNNDVFNVRIDSMPVHSSNTLFMNTVNGIGNSPFFATDFPLNYVNSGNTASMYFHYTPLNNGTFEVPTFPTARAEHGWYSAFQAFDSDHHVIMADTTTGVFSEFYQYYPNCITTAASIASNTATLTCTQDPIANEFLVGSTVVVGGFTGADTYFNVGTTSITAMTTTSISFHLVHANASASTNGHAGKNITDPDGIWNSASGISYSSMSYLLPTNNTTDAAGMQLQPMILGLQEFERAVVTGGEINHAFRNTFAIGIQASSYTWPATTFATDGSTIPFGARMRLKSSYDISGFSSNAQILLRALKRYGTINCDGGINYAMNAENTRWPSSLFDALDEIDAADFSTNMEFVNESSLMISTASSLTTVNREIITFTRTSDSSATITDINLMGPAVNFAKDAVYFMAGTSQQQIQVLNNYGGFTCSMSPSTGTLTSGCAYTPPATVSAATTTIITATSLLNSSATARTRVTVFPSTGIYVIPSKTSDFIDSHSTKWVARSGLSSLPDSMGCCACDNSASFGSFTDVELWNCRIGENSTYGGDTHMDFMVPNGLYQVVYNFGTTGCCSGGQKFKLSIQNSDVYYNLDPVVAAGGQYKTFTSTSTNVSVTDNQLLVGIWNMTDQGAPVSSLSVIKTGELPATTTPRIFRGRGILTGKGVLK